MQIFNRILEFKGDEVKCNDADVKLQCSREADNWEITINDFEHFTIPDAVVNGG